MRVVEVRYLIRLSLGNYEHEELSATVAAEPDEPNTGAGMMEEARRICCSNTTLAKRKVGRKAEEGKQNAK